MRLLHYKYIGLVIALLIIGNDKGKAQCSLGQTPQSAFTLCGLGSFQMATVPLCQGQVMVVPGCYSFFSLSDRNAFWYKFTCYTAGTLGFVITPINALDDYDWQLFDVTGADVKNVYTDSSLVVTGNWAGTYGNTGASATGVPYIGCASEPADSESTFSTMPYLIEGHQYLLMISHYNYESQSGYSISFDGGTAGITNPDRSHLQYGGYDCTTKSIYVKLSKAIRCSSVAANGSDFTLNVPGVVTTLATGGNCDSSFETDSLLVRVNKQLPPGNYQLVLQKGGDGNTLLDECDHEIAEGESIAFTVVPPAAIYMDSVKMAKCAPDSIVLLFTQTVDCASIAADGSDFVITGPSTVKVTRAKGVCKNNNASKSVILYLDKKILVGGTYQIAITGGSDGNAIASECGQALLAGDDIVSFTLQQQWPALFTVLPVSCKTQKITLLLSQPVQCASVSADGSDFSITGMGTIKVSKATWRCSNKVTDTIDLYFSEPVLLAGNYTVHVQAGKDGNTLLTPCWQQTPVDVAVSFSTKDTVSADFTYQWLLHCGEDTVAFYHDGAHGVNSWWWYFDDGADSSRLQTPVQYYHAEGVNTIKLVVSNGTCSDTLSKSITRINVLNGGFRVASDTICPGADVAFINESSGNIAGQYWTFGNGNSSNLFTPPRQQYPVPVIRDQLYQVQLVVQSNMNCYDTIVQVMHVLNSCYIAVPTGFTPNGDGLNDYLYPLNGFYSEKLDFKVFNRFGQLLFVTNSTSDKWDGRYKGEMQPPGVYVWMLSYIDKNTQQPVYLKGTSVLLR